jgi:hypothetical protein
MMKGSKGNAGQKFFDVLYGSMNASQRRQAAIEAGLYTPAGVDAVEEGVA